MKNLPKNALFLIDGSSLLYRSFYGLKPLKTSDGTPTQATYGFFKAIKRLLDVCNPTQIAVVWDHGTSGRTELFADYKATRQATPSELAIQRTDIKKILSDIKMPQLEVVGYEADDIIATVVKNNPDMEIVIVSPDKDLRQLITDRVLTFDPMFNTTYNHDAFVKAYGFEPAHLQVYHALVGDTSDNIPGVAGIGDKTATDLTQKFGSLEQMYSRLDEIEKKRTKMLLEAGKENAFLSYQLFQLIQVPMPESHENTFEYHIENWSYAYPEFKRLEFTSLTPASAHKQAEQVVSKNIESIPHEVVVKKSQLDALVDAIKQQKLCAFDTETTGLDPSHCTMVGFSCAFSDSMSYYIPLPIGAHIETELTNEQISSALNEIFSLKSVRFVMHNAKYDLRILLNFGVIIVAPIEDTLIMANILRKEDEKIGLKAMSHRVLNEAMVECKGLLKEYKSFDKVPLAIAAAYSAHDSLQTFKLYQYLNPLLAAEAKLEKLYRNLDMPLMWVLCDMEQAGILLDASKLKELEKVIDRQLQYIELKIKGAVEAAKGPREAEVFNCNSPKQVAELLFDVIGLKSPQKGKNERSTDHAVLLQLAEIHPVPGLLLEYREFAKLKSTYLVPLPETISPFTGRIHTTYYQTTVATGRLASSDPNLQNIPTMGEYGHKVREAFVATEGYDFLSVDYSQMELRVLAHFTNDANLIDAFAHGRDIHTETARQIFSVSGDALTENERRIGKRINFSIIYGLTPFGLSRELKISPSEAKVYIDRYFQQYPAVSPWQKSVEEFAIANGYVQTFLGRRRYLGGLREKNRIMFEAARRAAVNTVIQGTTAEIIGLAMIKIENALKEHNLKSRLLLQIHDELLLEVKIEEKEMVCKLVTSMMQSVVNWAIPLNVSTAWGKNWGDVSK